MSMRTDDAPAAPTMAEGMARIQRQPAPAWALPIIRELDQALARAEAWHRRVLAEGADWDAVARARHEVERARAQWENAPQIAAERRRAEFAAVVLPMLVRKAEQYRAADEREQKKTPRLREALNEVRREQGTKQVLLGEIMALRQAYADVLHEDHDSPTQLLDGSTLVALRVGDVAMKPHPGTQLQFPPEVFTWPARPAPAAPPAPWPCVDEQGTARAVHHLGEQDVIGRFGRQTVRACVYCGKQFDPPAAA